MTPPLWQKRRGTKDFLDESEREWKSWLKTQHSKNDHGIQSHHFMANRWGNNGNSDRLYFLGSKITADDDCSHEIKRHLLLGRKAMTNLDRLKSSEVKVTQSCLTVTPWTIQFMEFFRPEYWSWSAFPSSGDLSNPGTEPRSPALQADSLPVEPPGKPKNTGMGSLSVFQGNFLTQELDQGLLHCRWILYQLSYHGSH